MDQMAEDQLDFEDEEYGGSQKNQYPVAGGAISALADEEPMGDDDEYDDLYNDVNVGEGFLQMHRSEPPVAPGGASNGAQPQKLISFADRREDIIQGSQEKVIAVGDKKPEVGASGSQKGFQGSSVISDVPIKIAIEPVQQMNSGGVGPRGVVPQINVNANNNHQVVVMENSMRAPGENGSSMLFVGELHWWTTDAEIENVLSQYGRVKEIKFFDERASGKSKGYCQVEFFEAGAASACKEGMHGHVFNGRACVVAFASSQTLKQMGAAYANKNPVQNQGQTQGRRPGNDGVGRGGGGGDGGRGFGRGGGWGGRGQGVINRGPGTGGPMRGRGMGANKNMVGPAGGQGGGAPGGYGQGLPGHGFGGPVGAMMNPQAMMGSGFDPTYMGRGGGYGGFPGTGFPGMIPSFPGVNPMGLAAVAPHVNPAFFGRGMAGNGMGMMGGGSMMEGHHGGMWNDPSMGGWGGSGGAGGGGGSVGGGAGGGGGGEEHGRRTRESSYGGDDGSEYGYGDTNHEKGGRSSNVSRERDRGGSERDWSGNSERRHHPEERDQDYDKPEKEQREHRYREDKDGYRDHRQKDRGTDYDDDWDRGQSSSRPRSRSRAVAAEDHHHHHRRSRSRDVDYGKRRRLPSE